VGVGTLNGPPEPYLCHTLCELGAEPLNQELLINHWIPPFPPSPTLNAGIGRAPFLRGRLERCLRERGLKGAILAVDFYERTSAVEVAQELNGRP
jgi:hypothetical protein